MWDFFLNVFANFVALGLMVFIGWLIHTWLGRQPLLRFFGVNEEKVLKIFVGHVPNDNAPQGFIGFEEISEAKNLEALFRSVIPGLGDQPGLFKFLRVADIQIDIIPGVKNRAGVALGQNLVSIGAPSSNFVSELLQSELKIPIKCDSSNNDILIPKLGPISTNQAVIARWCNGGKTYFFIAGKTEPETAAGTRYLIQNWKSMRSRYGDKTPFFYLVEMRNDSRRSVICVANNELYNV